MLRKVKKLIRIILNGEPLTSLRIDPNENLTYFRQVLENKITAQASFLFDGVPLENEYENETTIEEILVDSKTVEIEDKSIIKKKPKFLKEKKIYNEENLKINEENIPEGEGIITVEDHKEMNQIKNTKKEPQIRKKIIEAQEVIKQLHTPVQNSRFLGNENGHKIYLYISDKFNEEENLKAKTILVVGKTGSGKTTLINSLTNYILGVDYDDDFRYYLVNEAKQSESKSKTREVTIYCIKSYNGFPPLKIIDTPGFGDTKGIEIDQLITDKIQKKFSNDVDTLTAICFVAPSSDSRLNAAQKYVFNKILQMFGKDVKQNFIAMITYSDAGKPPILDAFLDKESGFGEIIPYIKDDWYLQFNNSGIFSEKGNLVEDYWRMAFKNYKKFMDKINRLEPKSLQLSKSVLDERKRILISLEALQKRFNDGLVIMTNIKEKIDIVNTKKYEIEHSKNFSVTSTVSKCRKIPKQGDYTTYCRNCTYSCHEPCYLNPDQYKDKRQCYAIENDFCTVCPGHCHYSMHENYDYAIEYYNEEVTETIEELKTKYYSAQRSKSCTEQIIEGMKGEYYDIMLDCSDTQDQIKESLDRLKQIALVPGVCKSSEDYLEELIQAEEAEKKVGYLERINGLKVLKKQNENLRKIQNGDETELKKFIAFQKSMFGEDFGNYQEFRNTLTESKDWYSCERNFREVVRKNKNKSFAVFKKNMVNASKNEKNCAIF